ncbi:MAG: PAS domain-containing protein, partial [Lentisphaerae bacterium]|nr:PAS domain-containing protein [Lentisphaerota bacterium]
SGLTASELLAFLECLALRPEKLSETGGLKKALDERNLKCIQVTDVRYGRIDKDKEKAKEKDKDKSKKSAAGDDYLKTLRMASFVGGSTPAAPEAELPASLPSPEELKELYAIRERFKAELDNRVQEATRRYQVENKRLSFEKDTMDSVMRHVGEGVVVIGNDGNILMANPAAEKMLSNSGRAIVGHSLKESLRKEHSLVLSGGTPEAIQEIEVDGKDEETRKVLRSSNAVVEDKDGRTIGMVSVLSDVTKMKEVEQLKSDFVANVSHELRSPLAAIQKNIGLILDQSAGAVTDHQKEFLSLAKDNVERLTRLINDLLDLSKIEAGKMELKKTRTDLNTLARNAATAFTGWFREKNITCRLELPEAPLELELDADKITQVLNNLLSNALKFTPSKGNIRVALSTADGPVEVSVSDTGLGIEAKDQQRIFSKFEQVTTTHTNGVHGTGLGLPLAKEIVEKHGGHIRVKSEVGKGSTFTFSLPR